MSAAVDPEVQIAKDVLISTGHVVLREKSYRRAQERQRVAEAMAAAADDRRESVERWALNCLTEERRLRERLLFVYGVAKAHGATDADLRGTP